MLTTTRISRPALVVILIVLALLSLSLTTLPSYNIPFPSLNPVSPVYYIGSEGNDVDTHVPTLGAPLRHQENATLFMLASNSDLEGAVRAVGEMEDRFNREHNYPWVFLADQPFSDDFKLRVSNLASGPVYFGQIPSADWNQPPWINETKATEEREKMIMQGVPKSDSISYRNMCRFNSGFYFRHPLLQNFRYTWRVEPHVRYYCDVNFDPFAYLRENNKIYGFTLALYDSRATLESLWSAVKDFITEHPEYVAPNNAMDFVSDDDGADYNLCIFYNNFEIADMDFWRGEAYMAFFEHLDRTGGFYYERWGDAPVHTIGAALFAGIDQIHFFREIGYEHYPWVNCGSVVVVRATPNEAKIVKTLRACQGGME